MNRRQFLQGAAAAGSSSCLLGAARQTAGAPIDLRKATVMVPPGAGPNAAKTAATVLVEEISNRSGIRWAVSTSRPAAGPVIAITSEKEVAAWGGAAPKRADGAESKAEGYRIVTANDRPTLWIVGADARGMLFGVGRLLRELDWASDTVSLPGAIDIATAPTYPIRGHQLGYRAQANSYDAWDPAQFERYIRELTFFGVNSIEGIPFRISAPRRS